MDVPETARRPAATLGWRLLAVSGLTFACAQLLAVSIHELFHAVTALAAGESDVVLYSARLDHPTGSPTVDTVIALGGPVGSLLLGLVVYPLSGTGRGWPRLFLGFFALLNLNTFFGYLLTGPFLRDGDIGKALDLQSTPAWVGWLGVAAGVTGIVWTGRLAAIRTVQLVPADGDRPRALRQAGLFAWPIAAILTLAAIPPTYSAFVVSACTIGMFVLFVRVFVDRIPPGATGILGHVTPWLPAALYVALALAELVFLRSGIRLS